MSSLAWMMRRVENWKVLALATLLGAPWWAALMVFFGESQGASATGEGMEHLGFLVALWTGIVGGPILVLGLETIGTAVASAIVGMGGGLFVLPFVLIRLFGSLPPVWLARLLLRERDRDPENDDDPPPNGGPNGRGTVTGAAGGGSFLGETFEAGQTLLDVFSGGRVCFPGGRPAGRLGADGRVVDGNRELGQIVDREFRVEGRKIGVWRPR